MSVDCHQILDFAPILSIQTADKFSIVEPSNFTLQAALEAQGVRSDRARCESINLLQRKLSVEEIRLRNVEAQTITQINVAVAKLLQRVPAMSDRTTKFVQRQQSRFCNMRNHSRQAALQAALGAVSCSETKRQPSMQASTTLNEFSLTQGFKPNHDQVVMLACMSNLTTTQVRA